MQIFCFILIKFKKIIGLLEGKYIEEANAHVYKITAHRCIIKNTSKYEV